MMNSPSPSSDRPYFVGPIGTPDIIVLPTARAVDFQSNKRHIQINIWSPHERESAPTLCECPARVGFLQLNFYDYDKATLENIPAERLCIQGTGAMPNIFSVDNAHSISKFVKDNLKDLELVVLSCEGGMSRSVAVALGLSDWLHGKDSREAYRGHNDHVFEILREHLDDFK